MNVDERRVAPDVDERVAGALRHLAAVETGFTADLDDVVERVGRRRVRRHRVAVAAAAAVVVVAAVGGAVAGLGVREDGSTLHVRPAADDGGAGPAAIESATDGDPLLATTPTSGSPPALPSSPWWSAHELPDGDALEPQPSSYGPLAVPELETISTPTVGDIVPGDVLFDMMGSPMLWVSGIPWEPEPGEAAWQSVSINVPAGRAGGSVIIAYTADRGVCGDVLGVWGRLESTGGWSARISGPFTYGGAVVAESTGRQRYDIPIGDDLVDGGALLLLLRTRPSPSCDAAFTVQTSWGAVPEFNGIHPAPTTTWG